MNIKYPGRCLHMLSCFKNGSFQKRGYSPCVHVGPHPQTSPVKGRGTARRRWRGKVGRLRAIEKNIKPGGEPLRPSVAPVPLYLTSFVWTDYTILFYACLPFFAPSQRPHRIRRQKMKGRLFAVSPCRILLINIRVIFSKRVTENQKFLKKVSILHVSVVISLLFISIILPERLKNEY